MDKETLSNYGWIVICVLVLAVMIALSSPFGNYIAGAIKSTAQGLFDTSQKAFTTVGIPLNNTEFEEEEEANTIKYYQPYVGTIEGEYYHFVFLEDGSYTTYNLTHNMGYHEQYDLITYSEGEFHSEYCNGTIAAGGKEITITDGETPFKLTLGPVQTKYITFGAKYEHIDYYEGTATRHIICNEDGSIETMSEGESYNLGQGSLSYQEHYFTQTDGEYVDIMQVHPSGRYILYYDFVCEIACSHENAIIRNETDEMTGEKYCPDCQRILETSKPKIEGYALVLDNTTDTSDAYPMIFVKSKTPIKVGDTYNSKTYGNKKVLSVYSGFEYTIYHDIPRPLSMNRAASIILPWYDEGDRVTTIIVEDTIKPIATDYWFEEFGNCTRMDLNKLDLSKTTSIVKMFWRATKVKDLSSLHIPNNITDLTSTFAYCYALSVLPDMSNTKQITKLENTFAYCEALTKEPINLREYKNLTSIYNIFYGCKFETIQDIDNLQQLEIASGAFGNNPNLKNAPKLPQSLTDISRIFEKCTALEYVPEIISDQPLCIEDAFVGCESIKTVTINADIISSHTYSKAFRNVNNVKIYGWDLDLIQEISDKKTTAEAIITTPLGVQIIEALNGQKAYWSDENIKPTSTIIFSEGVTTIKQYAFQNVKIVRTIHLPSTIKTLEKYCFHQSGLTEIYFNGTMEQWEKVNKESNWNLGCKLTIHCTDGDIN